MCIDFSNKILISVFVCEKSKTIIFSGNLKYCVFQCNAKVNVSYVFSYA